MNLRRRPPHHAAEMLLQWLTLVCLAVTSMVTSAQLNVTLGKKSTVTFPSGSTLSFKCDLNTSGYKRFKLRWLFNPNDSSVINAKTISEKMIPNATEGMDLSLPWNVLSTNSGWYFCGIKQELPELQNESISNGTQVVIMKIVEHTTLQSLVMDEKASQSPLDFLLDHLWLLIFLGTSAFIVLLLICVLLKARCCKKKAEQPIYANTKGNNKQTLNDTLKPIPCSQNLRNPRPGRRYDEGKWRHKP